MNAKDLIEINKVNYKRPEDLLNPLVKLAELHKLIYVRTEFTGKLFDQIEKDLKEGIKRDYDEPNLKIDCLCHVENYLNALYEFAYQSNLAAFRSDQSNLECKAEIKELKKQIEVLKKGENF